MAPMTADTTFNQMSREGIISASFSFARRKPRNGPYWFAIDAALAHDSVYCKLSGETIFRWFISSQLDDINFR